MGVKFGQWLSRWPEKYKLTYISVRDSSWLNVDFSEYDVLLHTAALVHSQESKLEENDYFKINVELTRKLAEKAEKEGIKQFIFMSSFSVFGENGGVRGKVVLNDEHECCPTSFYGKSKLQAEAILKKVVSNNLVIVRAPMIFGPSCPGNYDRLRSFALRAKVFPKVENYRSMIYVDHLSEFLKLVIDHQTTGTFVPQNNEYINTSDMVRLIAYHNGRTIKLSPLLGKVMMVAKQSRLIKKVFGNLMYDLHSSSYFGYSYNLFSLSECIRLCEENK